ncbi:MAG: ATP synthase F1 subunit gamma [Kiritimatiellae bacterium]|nr:ATP synthase F1 subunit gamma [Kiritimatiellia bacterium]MDD5520559.1 ATP synthase F1 subunit gamma [Kiritimatiellia bacterium]
MLTLKEYNVKLARLKNTRKMTKTMKMVSANKLRKAQKAQKYARTFEEKVNSIVNRIGVEINPEDHPLLNPKRTVSKALIIVFTSDKGLCGGFNSNLNRKTTEWLSQNSGRFTQIEMSFSGRRGFLFFKNRFTVRKYYEGIATKPQFADAYRIGNDLQTVFLNGQFDEIYVAYNQFTGVLSHKPVVEKLMPAANTLFPSSSKQPEEGIWIYEPARYELLLTTIPKLINLKIYSILIGTSAGEQGARMTAMDNATKNADELIEHFTLLRNRARQSKITKELTEIVGGAEALK